MHSAGRVRRTALAHARDVCKTQNQTWATTHGGARRTAPSPVCRKRPFATLPSGYARVSKADGSQSLDLQRDALRAEGIDDAVNLYHGFASGVRDDRPGLDSCVDFWALVIGLVAWIKFLDYLFGL